MNDEVVQEFHPLWYEELAVLDIPQPSWVVDQLVPAESITIMSAPPAHYKTWIAFDIAIQVAHGEPLFGQFETKQNKVLIIDEESGFGRARERLAKLGAKEETSIAITSYISFKLNEESAGSLVSYCSDYGIGLVIFDSLTRIHSGDENSAKDMSVVMGNLKRLAQAGIAVIIIHHNRKPGQFERGGANEMRGSGDILAACDVQISLKRKAESNIIKVVQNKNRDASNMKPFDLEVNSDEDQVWFKYVGSSPEKAKKSDRTDEAILKLLGEGGMFQEQIITILKPDSNVGGERMIADRLKALVKSEDLVPIKGARGKLYYELSMGQLDG